MSVTLTYENALSRVKVVGTGVGGATTAVVERSLDQVIWQTVRGGSAAPVVAGTVTVYDYEFAADVLNYYRVTTPKDVTFVGKGTASHANNASVTPGLPAGHAAGDTLLLLAAIRGTGGSPVAPAGYSILANIGNLRMLAKIDNGAEVAPTVTFLAGAAGDDTSAQMAAFRGTSGVLSDAPATRTPGAAQQNIPYFSSPVSAVHALVVYFGWKADDWIGVNTLAGDGGVAAEIDEPSTTLGNDQGIVWDYCVQTTQVDVSAGSFVVTGGGAATSSSGVLVFRPDDLKQVASITPSLNGQVWIKSIRNPFLNRAPYCVTNASAIVRRARTALFDVLGRSDPVAVTDLRRSREFSVDVVTRTEVEHKEFNLVLGAGDVMFLHTPDSYPLDSMYVVFGDSSEGRPLRNRSCDADWRVFTLPATEVVAPDPSVVGSTITWQGVLNVYATWQDVINAKATWFDLLQSVGNPVDVIVP